MSDNTLRKSRNSLAASGLIYYETSKDKRIGCYYSFVKKLSNDIVSPAESSAISYSKITDDIAGDIKREMQMMSRNHPQYHPQNHPQKMRMIRKVHPQYHPQIFEDETQIPPIIDIKTINEESLARTHESPPPEKPKKSRKKMEIKSL